MLLVSTVGCSDTSQLTEPFPFEPAAVRSANPKDFIVYTQNVYLGGIRVRLFHSTSVTLAR